MIKDWSIWHTRRGWEGWDNLAKEKAQEDLINVYLIKFLSGKGEFARLFSVVPSDKTRGNRHKLKHFTSHLNRIRNFFTERVITHRNRLPREAVEFRSSLEAFKTQLGNVLSYLLLLILLEKRSWTRWSPVPPSNLNHSVILWFCRSLIMYHQILRGCGEISPELPPIYLEVVLPSPSSKYTHFSHSGYTHTYYVVLHSDYFYCYFKSCCSSTGAPEILVCKISLCAAVLRTMRRTVSYWKLMLVHLSHCLLLSCHIYANMWNLS